MHDFLLSNNSAATVIVDSLFKGMSWYERLNKSAINVYIYCSDIPELVSRIENVNNTNMLLSDSTETLKLILFAIDSSTEKTVSIGNYVNFNHINASLKTSFSLSNSAMTYAIDSYRYNITLYELESYNEVVGQSSMITRITMPQGFIDSNSVSRNLDRYTGSLLCLRSLTFDTVSWLPDIQDGESYNTLSLYICNKEHLTTKVVTSTYT